MEIDQISIDPEIHRLNSLLQGTRGQLARALEEASQLRLQAWTDSEVGSRTSRSSAFTPSPLSYAPSSGDLQDEEGGSRREGASRSSDLTEEDLAGLSAREREAALK